MNNISITLDVSKISKHKIVDRTYTNRNNEQVTSKEYKIDLVPLKEQKVIKTGDSWVLKKTHFVAEQQSKEEKASKTPTVYVGEGFQFFDKAEEERAIEDTGAPADIQDGDIPF